jgi:hypothetical protein
MRSPFQNVVYVQLKRRWMSIRILSWAGGDSKWEGVPEFLLARDRRGRLNALTPGAVPPVTAVEVSRCALLNHPRTAIGNYTQFLHGLRCFAREAGFKRALSKPLVIFHLHDFLEGGLTELEERAFGQLAMEFCSGQSVVLCGGDELSAPEVVALARGERRPEIHSQ